MISTYKKKRLRQDLFLSEFAFWGTEWGRRDQQTSVGKDALTGSPASILPAQLVSQQDDKTDYK